jgi:hypothetical protein
MLCPHMYLNTLSSLTFYVRLLLSLLMMLGTKKSNYAWLYVRSIVYFFSPCGLCSAFLCIPVYNIMWVTPTHPNPHPSTSIHSNNYSCKNYHKTFSITLFITSWIHYKKLILVFASPSLSVPLFPDIMEAPIQVSWNSAGFGTLETRKWVAWKCTGNGRRPIKGTRNTVD